MTKDSSSDHVHISIKADPTPTSHHAGSPTKPTFSTPGTRRIRDMSLFGQNASLRGFSFRPQSSKLPTPATSSVDRRAEGSLRFHQLVQNKLKALERTSLRKTNAWLRSGSAARGKGLVELEPESWLELIYAVLLDAVRWLWVVDRLENEDQAAGTSMSRSLTDPTAARFDLQSALASSGSERMMSHANTASRRPQSISVAGYYQLRSAEKEEVLPPSTTPRKPKGPVWSALYYLDRQRRSLAISRISFILLCFVSFLGLREAFKSTFVDRNTATTGITSSYSLSSISSSPSVLPTTFDDKTADVTAILLNWNRLPSLKISIEHLCQQPFIKHIVIWNNNPSLHLSRSDFSTLQCHPLRLKIHNSITNSLFLARHLACAQASTPYCLHLDDEYLLWSIKSLYATFKADKNPTLSVMADSEYTSLYEKEWRFRNPKIGLDAQFAWLGYGSLVSKSNTAKVLEKMSMLDMKHSEMALADNYFATFLNRPVKILEGRSVSLDQRPVGFSDGSSGLERNKAHIGASVNYLVQDLSASGPSPASALVTSSIYKSPCASDQCTFISNVPQYLAPSPTDLYPAPAQSPAIRLRQWEEQHGFIGTSQSGASNWTASSETVALQKWAIAHPASYAVDGDYATAWISPFPVAVDQFIGLALLSAFKPASRPTIQLDVTIEYEEELLPNLQIEVSGDANRWTAARSNKAVVFHCKTTPHASHFPSPAFPLLSNQKAFKEQPPHRKSGQSWLKRHRRLAKCSVDLLTSLPVTYLDEKASGWKFVRLRLDTADGLESVGWIVYELGLSA